MVGQTINKGISQMRLAYSLAIKMHPTGLEPATKASEAYVLSIRLRVHIQHSYSSTKHELVL